MILDILIPVYNEQENILNTLNLIDKDVNTNSNIIICYDYDEDPSLNEIKKFSSNNHKIILVKNKGSGVASAIKSGISMSESDFLIIYNADDFHNSKNIDKMVELGKKGNDVIAPSRYIKGGISKGVRKSKALIAFAGSWVCFYILRFPIRDFSYCFRMFSRKVIDNFDIDSIHGFTIIIEYTVKAHRKNYNLIEIPATYIERVKGESKFKLIKWLPFYLRWVIYLFMTNLQRIFK
jgi:dolichol-phosphate mannosyltransferase